MFGDVWWDNGIVFRKAKTVNTRDENAFVSCFNLDIIDLVKRWYIVCYIASVNIIYVYNIVCLHMHRMFWDEKIFLTPTL